MPSWHVLSKLWLYSLCSALWLAGGSSAAPGPLVFDDEAALILRFQFGAGIAGAGLGRVGPGDEPVIDAARTQIRPDDTRSQA